MLRIVHSVEKSISFCLPAVMIFLSGCHSIGPFTVTRDRFEYSGSVGESWKRQTLLNIVKLRYLDPPTFVEVGQIVAGYTLQAGANMAAAFAGDDSLTFGGLALYSDRPTITYIPLTGNKFVKSILMPLPPESAFFLIQTGWPADGIMFSAVASINGLKNSQPTLEGVIPPDPGFLRMAELMRKIQLSGAVGIHVQEGTQKKQNTIVTFRSRDIKKETLDDMAELRKLLRLSAEAGEFKLVLASTPSSDKEIAVVTRSMVQIMATMAAQVEVPVEDLAKKRTPAGWESVAGLEEKMRAIRIYNSKSKPPDSFVSVNYRRHWFWIDDCDLKSKRAFSLLMTLFTMAEPSEKENLPLLTIPTQ